MRRILLISPHFDDAVLSAGQLLAGRPDADVVTIYAGKPSNLGMQTTYDAKCGFENAEQAMNARTIENDEALALLKANPIDLTICDTQYGYPRNEDEFIANRLLAAVPKDADYEFIVAPLGLGHPDHIQATQVAIIVAKRLKVQLYLWEDLPLRVVEPERVTERLAALKVKHRVSIGEGPIAHKIRALSCYRSQIGTGILDPYLMYVPERFWKYE